MENPAEVKELRNKLRMMKLPQEEILNTVRKQQRAIHKQKLANETIRNEIDQYEKELQNIDKELEEYKTNEELQKLQTQKKNLANKLSVISADVVAEEQKRKKLEEDVSKANSRAGGLYQQARENEMLQAKLRTMENRLDKVLLRYNANLNKLESMRAHLDELRKERFTFRNVIKNTENDKQKKDKQIGELISSSNESYAKRDQLKMDLVQLKQAEAEDIKNFDEEYSRLTQQIEGQRITQNRPREHQQQLPSLNSQIGSQSDQQEEMTQATEQMNVTIQRILDLMECKDVSQLLQQADKIESENFSLYNFVVENGAKKSKLQDDIDALELQHSSLLSQIERNDNEQKDELEEITKNIKDVSQEQKEVRNEKEQNEEKFKSVYSAIENLFNKLNCSWDNTPDEKQNISPANAMYCLSNIEVAMAEIMNNVAEKAKLQFNMRGVTDFSTLLGDEKTESHSISKERAARSEKELPKTIDGIDKPMTLEEIRAMLN